MTLRENVGFENPTDNFGAAKTCFFGFSDGLLPHRRPGFSPANPLFIRYVAGLKPGLHRILLICIHYMLKKPNRVRGCATHPTITAEAV